MKEMTNRYEETLAAFEGKLQRLVAEYKSLKEQNAHLRDELDRKQTELMHAHKALLDLQQDYDHLRTARYLNTSPRERRISRQYINRLVREIDRCLALLNE